MKVAKAGINYDTSIPSISNGPSSLTTTSSLPSPALRALARLLGQQAAAHVHKYRFEGLGRITLMRLQEEALDRLN
jgi:hypothetical protein